MNLFWLSFLLIGNFWHVLEAQGSSYLSSEDPELIPALQEINTNFVESLQQEITDPEMSSDNTIEIIKLKDQSFKVNDKQITLENFVIETHPNAYINEINPNLLDKSINLTAGWDNVILKGNYEITDANTPINSQTTNTRNIIINLGHVGANGLVGFEIPDNKLETNNFNLNFNIQEKIDSSIAKYIQSEIYLKLQESLKKQLDQALDKYTVSNLFAKNPEMSQKYLQYSKKDDDITDKVVSQLIENIRDYITTYHYDQVPVPNANVPFSRVFGLFKYLGRFEAQQGYLGNLSRIRIMNAFSKKFISDSESQYFGSLGYYDLLLYYGYFSVRIFNLGPRGDIRANIGMTSFRFTITVDKIKRQYRIKYVDLHLESVGEIRVKATGLTFLLNWLYSWIISWVTGRFRYEIVSLLEKTLREVVSQILPMNIK